MVDGDEADPFRKVRKFQHKNNKYDVKLVQFLCLCTFVLLPLYLISSGRGPCLWPVRQQEAAQPD